MKRMPNIYIYGIFIPIFFITSHDYQNRIIASKGTVIVGYIKNDTIWLGVDSRETYVNWDTLSLKLSDTTGFDDNICKMHIGKDFAVANAGLLKIGNVDIGKIIKNTISFNVAAEINGKKIMDKINTETIRYFTNFYRGQDTTLNDMKIALVFAFFHNNTPLLQEIKFTPTFINGKWGNEVQNFFPIRLHDETYFLCASDCSCIIPFVNREIFDSVSYIPDIITELIKKQSACTKSVGSKIDIIRINKGNVIWIKREDNCK